MKDQAAPKCSERQRERARAYYARNREKMLENAAVYRQKNKELLAAKWKKYYVDRKAELYRKKKVYLASNPAKVRLWKRADYERNRDAYIARAAAHQCKDVSKANRARHYQENRHSILARQRDYRKQMPEKRAEYMRLYRASAKGRELRKASDRRRAARAAAYKAEWARKNREKINERFCMYVHVRSKSDPAFAIGLRLRSRVVGALRRHIGGIPQSITATIRELLGCPIAYLVRHLESKFPPGMSWENRSKWHIDHIKPLCAFDLTKREEKAKEFHYTNLQPLWALDNMRKGAGGKHLMFSPLISFMLALQV